MDTVRGAKARNANEETSIATGRFVQDTTMLIREHEANDAMAARLSLGKPALEGLPGGFSHFAPM